MNKKLLILGLFLMILPVVALAQTMSGQNTFAADSLYQSAEIYYKSGDYQNAVRAIYRAKTIYVGLNDALGISKTNQLIAQIEGVLSPLQLADMYYNIAGGYYLDTEMDVDALNQAITMAEKAKILYQKVGGSIGSSGVLKCEDVISGSEKKVRSAINQCIREGDDAYSLAQNSFYIDDIMSARNFAANASSIYVGCPYPPGMDKAAALLTSINLQIKSNGAEAKAAYDQAIKALLSEQWEICNSYATDSRELYLKIGDNEGVASANSVISQCSHGSQNIVEEMLKTAAQYKREAEYFSLKPDCLNATDRANKAKAIYQELWDMASKKETDVPLAYREDIKYYNTLKYEVNAILQKIGSSCHNTQMLEIAENYYKQAQNFYLENKLNDAQSYGGNAKSIYENLKNFVGISKTETLLAQINQRIKSINEANDYFRKAESAGNVARFEEALIEANRAKTIYESIRKEDKVQEVEEFEAMIQAKMQKFDLANKHFTKSKQLFDSRDWTNSLSNAVSANQLYTEVNYTLGITESAKMVDVSQKNKDAEDAEFRKTILFASAMILLAGFLILQFVKRRSSMEGEFQRMRQAEAEQRRREHEEWEIKSRDETKSRVDDELKKLIEKERGTSDE